jgi:AcrR family transcriptional regulator
MAMVPPETIDWAALAALLWGKAKPKARGPKPTRSLEELLDAAIGIADAEGLEAISMQRLAQDLGFTKMAIYRYVPGRTELLALMTDRALGPAPVASTDTTWRTNLEAWALAAFDVFRRHPWGIATTSGPRVIGPNEAGWTEAGLEALKATGLHGADKLDVLAVVTGHLRSMAQQFTGTGSGAARGVPLEALLVSGIKGHEAAFPHFANAVAEAASGGGADNGLSFGLNCILDGVEAQIARRGDSGNAT